MDKGESLPPTLSVAVTVSYYGINYHPDAAVWLHGQTISPMGLTTTILEIISMVRHARDGSGTFHN